MEILFTDRSYDQLTKTPKLASFQIKEPKSFFHKFLNSGDPLYLVSQSVENFFLLRQAALILVFVKSRKTCKCDS